MGKTVGLIIATSLLCGMHDARAGTFPDSVPRLPTVHIRSRGGGVHVRQDTIEYQASAYKGPEVRKVQDLLAKLEGFSVSPDGHVHFNGQEIETILVNGEDMTGSNYRLLSRYLRAGLVKKVQLIRNYDPDPLMHELRASGKVGLSLVLHDSLSHTLSGGVDVGASHDGRKDMDLHLLDLHGPGKFIALGSWNTTGITTTNNRDFYARDDDQGTVRSHDEERVSPACIGTLLPPALPEPYVRNNDDRTATAIWKRSLLKGQRLGFIMGMDRTGLGFDQEKRSSYVLTDGSSWSTNEQERARTQGTGFFFRSEYLADHGRKERSQIWLDMYAKKELGFHKDEIDGAVTDHQMDRDRMFKWGAQAHLRTSRRLRHGAIFIEGDLGWRQERQRFELLGSGVDSGWLNGALGILEQQWCAREWRQHLLMRYVPARRQRPGWGLRYDGREGMRSAQWSTLDRHAGTLDLSRQAFTFESEGERKAGRNARWQWSVAAGLGCWRYGSAKTTRTTELHDFLFGYERRTGPMRVWNITYRDTRSLPEEKYVLPMDVATGKYTLISPQMAWKPMDAHQLSFRYTSRSLAAGAGAMFLISYTRHEHALQPAWTMKPGFTRIQPMVNGRSDDLHGSVNGDVWLSLVRVKLSGDLHVTARWGSAWVNEVWSERVMRDAGGGLRLTSAWRSVINLEAGWTLRHSTFLDRSRSGEQVFRSWSGTTRLKLRVRWNERWYAAMSMDRYSMPGLPSFYATDLFLSWQCHERLGFSLTGHNLIDRRHSVTHWATAGAEGETIFHVVPAYLLWKLSWSI